MPVIRCNIGEQVKSDGELNVTRIEICQIICTVWRYVVQQFLSQIEPVLPGLSARWNGRATVDWWPGNPYSLGSYSYWQTGQYTRFAGIEGGQEANAHFCGEHTSIDAQGYLEGAVETGERAAGEVINDLL